MLQSDNVANCRFDISIYPCSPQSARRGLLSSLLRHDVFAASIIAIMLPFGATLAALLLR